MRMRTATISTLLLFTVCFFFCLPSNHARPMARRGPNQRHQRGSDLQQLEQEKQMDLRRRLQLQQLRYERKQLGETRMSQRDLLSVDRRASASKRSIFDTLTNSLNKTLHGIADTVVNVTHVIEEEIEELEDKIERALESIDVDLLHVDLKSLGKTLLDTVHNLTITPLEFLEKYGYLVDPDDEGFILRDVIEALMTFQKMYHITLSGILDLSTIKAMLQPRCGMPDIITQAISDVGDVLNKVGDLIPVSKRGIDKRNNIPGYKWTKTNLSFKIHNYYSSAELSPATQRQALINALNYWQQASTLTFTETTGTADLNIKFVNGEHGDGTQNAFDGPGGVLAHAFYPMSGEAHFDSSERFTDEKPEGINLKIVAAHEFGHAFGLGHSEVQGALMAPYYQGFEANYKLPADDIQGIQKIYGSRDGMVAPVVTQTTTTTTTTPPPRIEPVGAAPATCTVPFRAITQTHDYRVYAFNGRYMWRMSDYGLDEEFPVTVDSYYDHPPDSVEAAIFTRKHYFTYLFKGRDVYVYYGFQLVEKDTITTPGFPSSVQAAIELRDGTICIVQGGYCWIFDEDSSTMVSPTPRLFRDLFPGAPSSFDSLLRLEEENDIFFFSGDNYYRYSEASRSVVSGYPKKKAGPWLGPACNAPPYTPK